MQKRKRIRFAALAAVTALATGCAKVPTGTGDEGGRLVEVTMTLRGDVRIDGNNPYYYIFLMNRTDNPGDAGPVPVVGVPWNNGFAAASNEDSQGFVGFVVFSALGGLTGYQVYAAPTDATGNLVKPQNVNAGIPGGWIPRGAPDNSTVPQAGEKTLRFLLDLSKLPNPDARYLQINFLATNNLPVGADPNAPKTWDALGNGAETGNINNWVTIDVTQNSIRSDADSIDPEPTGDVREKLAGLVNDPSLDIDDWSISVRSR